jgi:hypothetical protein
MRGVEAQLIPQNLHRTDKSFLFRKKKRVEKRKVAKRKKEKLMKVGKKMQGHY